MFETEAFIPYFKDFFCPADTNFGALLAETADLLRSSPELLLAIDHDLDVHALQKKELREADRRFDDAQTATLAGIDEAGKSFRPADHGALRKLEHLEIGRPRTPALVVGVLLVVRGYCGSCTDQKSIDLFRESKSLDHWLNTQNATLPARSTLSELLNVISEETRAKILAATLDRASQEDLDSFEKSLIDSTAVRACSSWPTDVKISFGLCRRLWNIGNQFQQFGLKNIQKGWMGNWLKSLEKLMVDINLNPKNDKKFQSRCRQFINVGKKILSHGLAEYKRLGADWNEGAGKLRPSTSVQVYRKICDYLESLNSAGRSLEQMYFRIFENRKYRSIERILSICDESAAYIQKGGREAVIGYKPQLARSGNGFVTALLVEEGNISDSICLLPALQTTIANTGVVPDMVSVDDGYASKANLEQTKDLGVKIISISGAKGKRLLGEKWEQEEYQEARKSRSAVESLMFCLKYSYRFGQLSRTGLEAVRQELMEKTLAYNIARLVYLRKRKHQFLRKSAA